MSWTPTGPDVARAGEPYRCCLCGQRNPRCLCRRCRLAHTDAAGRVAPWLRALQREADRQSKRAARLRGRLVLLSFDALAADAEPE